MPWSKLYACAGPGKQINTEYYLPKKEGSLGRVNSLDFIIQKKKYPCPFCCVFEDFIVCKEAGWSTN